MDDDKQTFKTLSSYLTELLGNSTEIVGFSSAEQFLPAFKDQSFDLITLDIFMDKMTGVDLARAIRLTDKNTRIIFCTASNDFASESYEVDACYYLKKPFTREKIKSMLDRLNIEEMEKNRRVTLPDGTTVVLRDVIYADFACHCASLHCKNGKTLNVRLPFSEIERSLCAYKYFSSPYKGVVVNFYEIKAHSADTFTLSDGSLIPISRRRAKDVLDAYSSFRFETLRKGGEL